MKDTEEQEKYIAPLKYNWLTGLYDPLIRWTLRERTFKCALIEQAHIAAGQRVLDLGCGTATMTVLIKRQHPHAAVFGLDADDRALAIARRKIKKSGLAIELNKGLANRMAFEDSCFDRVLSSLVFHHLSAEHKQRAAAEIYRVLKPGGEMHVADWGKAENWALRAAFVAVQLLDGFATTSENVQGKLPAYFRAAGFKKVRECRRFVTVFGTLALYAAVK